MIDTERIYNNIKNKVYDGYGAIHLYYDLIYVCGVEDNEHIKSIFKTSWDHGCVSNNLNDVVDSFIRQVKSHLK